MPKEPGEAQKKLCIAKEASYIISVISPKRPAPTGYLSVEEQPKYPQEVLKEFDETENFASLANKDTKFIDYKNAQIYLRSNEYFIKKDTGMANLQ